MFSSFYNTVVNMLPNTCKHLVFTNDRKCVDCGYQLPSEFQMDIYLNENDKPVGFVLVNVNNNYNLAEVKELILDQVETVSNDFRYTIRGVPISEKQETRFKAYEVYRANKDKLIIQYMYNNDF